MFDDDLWQLILHGKQKAKKNQLKHTHEYKFPPHFQWSG